MVDKIELSNIRKIERHEYFDKSECKYKTINKKLQSRTMILMLCAYLNHGKEVLLLMNNKSYNFKISKGNSDSVALSEEMEKWMLKSKSSFTAFHHHPDEGTFSLDDLEQFILHHNIQLLILCTNTCKYCAGLYKSRQLTQQETQAILYYIQKYKSQYNMDGHGSAEPLIIRLQKQGLIYLYSVNGGIKNEETK